MKIWHIFCFAFLTVLFVFLLATGWEFGIEEIAETRLGFGHEKESLHETWEPVVMATVLAALALIVPVMMALKISAQRQEAQDEIARTAHILKTTFESMSQGISVVDADLKLVAVNQRYVDLWRYPPGFIRLGMPFEEIARFKAERGDYGPGEVEALVTEWVAAMREAKPLQSEFTTPDGTVFVMWRAPMPGGGVINTFTDITERKKAEKALRESEAQLVDAIESISEGFALFDAEDRLVLYNTKYKEMYPTSRHLKLVPGTRFEDIIRASAEKGLHASAIGRVEEWVRERLEQHYNPRGAVEQRLSDGRWLRVTERRTRDGGTVGIRADITELKRAEAEIARKSALLDTTFESMSQGIAVFDADLKLIAYNQQYLDLRGYPEGFFHLGQSYEKIVRFNAERGEYGPGDSEKQVRERINHGRQGTPWRSEYTRSSGTSIAVRLDPMPGGGFVTTYTDITERKRAEEALRESEARLVNAQRIARLGDWERNLETGEVHWSDQMYDIFAITPEQFSGTREAFIERVHPDDRELVEEIDRMALNEGTPFDVEYRIVRPDTSERVIHSQGEVEFDAAGKPVRISGTVQDITERKSLEERIRQIHKLDAVGKLAGGVAHEFNNLLFVLRGNMDLLGLRIEDNPEHRQILETMTRQIRRGSYLTHLLVAYARQQPLRPKEMDINSVVRETAKLLEGSLSDAIEIDTVCAQDLWATMVDRGELESAIVNLAVNAQDAMPEGGKLITETANVWLDDEFTAIHPYVRPGEYVKLAVTDTGCGMAAVVAERAFEPFFTTKEVGKGTGLGLSMVYGFVKQSGGYVTIDSEPGNGTTVSVYLPKAVEAQA